MHFSKEVNNGAEDTASWIKCLPCEREELSSALQNPRGNRLGAAIPVFSGFPPSAPLTSPPPHSSSSFSVFETGFLVVQAGLELTIYAAKTAFELLVLPPSSERKV